MIYIRKYKDNILIDEKIFLNFKTLEEAVDKISSRDLKTKKVTVESDNEDLTVFFRGKYNPKFYKKEDNKNNVVTLLYIEDGGKRKKHYIKNYKRKFEKILERIKTQLQPQLSEAFKRETLVTYHLEAKDKNVYTVFFELSSDAFIGTMTIFFNIVTLEYVFYKTDLTEFEEIYKIFKAVINYNTAALRKYRAK